MRSTSRGQLRAHTHPPPHCHEDLPGEPCHGLHPQHTTFSPCSSMSPSSRTPPRCPLGSSHAQRQAPPPRPAKHPHEAIQTPQRPTFLGSESSSRNICMHLFNSNRHYSQMLRMDTFEDFGDTNEFLCPLREHGSRRALYVHHAGREERHPRECHGRRAAHPRHHSRLSGLVQQPPKPGYGYPCR